MKAPPKTFKDWIDETGVSAIAQKLSIQESTVRHWRRGHCLPTTRQMRKIRKLSKGAVTYEAIIDAKEVTT